MNDNTDARPMTNTAVLLLSVAFLAMVLFQTYILMTARQNLSAIRTNQEQPLQQAAKLRQRVEGLAARTADLAAQGNPAAAAIVENFRRQGVELKKPAPQAEPISP